MTVRDAPMPSGLPRRDFEMTAPAILFDPWPRTAPLIFTPETQRRFERLGRIVGLAESASGRLPDALVDATLPNARAIVGQTDLDAARLSRAPHLAAIVNVEGNFAQNVDYGECSRFCRSLPCSLSRLPKWRSASRSTSRAASRARIG